MKRYFLILSMMAVSLLGFAADPAGVSGAFLWLKADDAEALSDGTLKQWKDLTGVHKFKAVGDKKGQIQVVKDVLNGHSVVRFPGEAALESTAPMTYMTFVVVSSLSKEGCVGGLRAQEETKRPPYFFTVKPDEKDTKNPFKTMLNDGENVINGKFSPRYQIMWASMGNPDVDEFIINGYNNAKTKKLTRVAPHSLALGCGYSQAGKKYFFLQGDIAEVIAFPSYVSKENRFAIENYLAEKYGITIYTHDMQLEKPNENYRIYRNSKSDVIWNGSEGDMDQFRFYMTFMLRDDAWGINHSKAHGMGNGNQTEEGALSLVNGDHFDHPKAIESDLTYVVAGQNKENGERYTEILNPMDNKLYTLLLRQYRFMSNTKDKVSMQFMFNKKLAGALDPQKVGIMVVDIKGNARSYSGVFNEDYNYMIVNGIQLSGKDNIFIYINAKDNNNLNQ